MNTTVNLTASARYGYGGKQYIARITGRDSNVTFAREFVGRKTGKRREDAEYDTDESGLYVECDIDSKGQKEETYYLISTVAGYGLTAYKLSKEQTMALAKRLDYGSLDWNREGLLVRLEDNEADDQDGEVTLKEGWLGTIGGKVKRSEYVVILKAALAGDKPQVNPLADFTDEQITAEYQRRKLIAMETV